MKKNTVLFLVCSMLALPVFASEQGLPDPEAPFQAKNPTRQKFLLKTTDVLDKNKKSGIQPYFESGNKQVFFHTDWQRDYFKNPEKFTFMSGNQEIAAFSFSGSIPAVGSGSPFKSKDGNGTLSIDEKNQTITFKKEYLAGKEKTAVFTYTVKNADEGKLEIDWNLGLSDKEIALLPAGSSLALNIRLSDAYRELGVKHNGTEVKLLPDAELLAAVAALPANKWNTEQKTVGSFNNGGVVQVGNDELVDGFKLDVDKDYTVTIQENGLRRLPPVKELSIRIGLKKLMPSGSFILDLGATGSNVSPYPAVGGVDFWKSDHTHVPKLPTKNLLPNPSFEQGLRYWTWMVRGGGGEYKPDPKAPPCYEISNDAKFGKHSLKINATQGNRTITSFPIPVEVGKEYTVSFYSKGGTVRVSRFPALPEKGNWADFVVYADAPKSADWQRTSFNFTAKMPAECLAIASAAGCMIDGLQVEEGKTATDFVMPEVEGYLSTADTDNCLRFGQDFKAVFNLSGKPGAEGKVKLKACNFYRETVYEQEFPYKLDASGSQQIPLTIPPEIGAGIFTMQAEFFVNNTSYAYDYSRFSVLKFLENKHPTKNIFGIQLQASRITRGDDLGELYKRWGFGSTSYQDGWLDPEFFTKYGISNMLCQCSRAAFSPEWLKQPLKDIFYAWEEMNPEREKIVEDIAFTEASNPRKVGDVWAFNTESEGHTRMWKLGHYDQFIKLQMASRKGIKRARPNAVVLVDGGTSGFQPGRGYDVMEKMLQASKGVTVWEGLAIHPYGLQDGIDDSIAYLKMLADKYQPGANTKLYMPECSAEGFVNVPEWEKIAQWYGDRSGRPSYDTGWKEFMHASFGSRMYLIGLKYWPRMNNINLWTARPFFDMQFAPFMLCGATNTLGNLFGKPEFVADYMPASGIKGLIFTDDKNCGLAAVWCNSPKVESGLIKGPKLVLKPGDAKPEFLDLMGNVRIPEIINGQITVQLSPAPMFIKSAPGKAKELTESLMKAVILGSDSAVSLKCLPDSSGNIDAEITNQTHNPLKGTLSTDDKNTDFSPAPKETKTVTVGKYAGTIPGVFYEWNKSLNLTLSNGFASKIPVSLTGFYIPRTGAPLPVNPEDPAWKKIPALQITNWYKERGVEGGQPGDLAAEFRMAWDENNIYLHVECKDDKFLADPEGWVKNLDKLKTLWKYDGSVEVYFDTFANARSKSEIGYDTDDYRYDFYAKDGNAQSGPGSVYRQVEVFTEYAGGPSMPTKKDVENGGIKCQFLRNGNNYSYVMIFPQAYLLPLKLAKGSRTGFGIFVHDWDLAGKYKGLSLATKPGEQCYNRPDLWPIMVLE